MGIERALGAGAGELDRGRTWRGDDRVRRRSHWNPNEPEHGESQRNPSPAENQTKPERRGEAKGPEPSGDRTQRL